MQHVRHTLKVTSIHCYYCHFLSAAALLATRSYSYGTCSSSNRSGIRILSTRAGFQRKESDATSVAHPQQWELRRCRGCAATKLLMNYPPCQTCRRMSCSDMRRLRPAILQQIGVRKKRWAARRGILKNSLPRTHCFLPSRHRREEHVTLMDAMRYSGDSCCW